MIRIAVSFGESGNLDLAVGAEGSA